MYGTIARCRLLPGAEAKLAQIMAEASLREIPGYLQDYIFRMDQDSNEIYLVSLFRDRETYIANANSPEMDADYRKFRALLEKDPEWHDGEVIFPTS